MNLIFVEGGHPRLDLAGIIYTDRHSGVITLRSSQSNHDLICFDHTDMFLALKL
jgi:hypothetical protein